MVLLQFVAMIIPIADQEFTLKNLIAIDKLEFGTDSERIIELETAIGSIHNYEMAATADEFRIVALGLRHQNQVIRAESARLLELLTTKTTNKTVGSIVNIRNNSQISDDDWLKIAFHLARHSAIPSCDAYRGIHQHFPGRRCGDFYHAFRSFDFDSYILTTDLDILEYALNRQLTELKYPPTAPEFKLSPTAEICLKGLISVHPESKAAELARQLFDQIGKGKSQTMKK